MQFFPGSVSAPLGHSAARGLVLRSQPRATDHSFVPIHPARPCPRLLPALVAFLLGAHAPAHAQSVAPSRSAIPDDLKALSLEQLMEVKVVTATQIESDPFDLPFMASSRTTRDYERTLPRTLPQWLADEPGVMVQKTANGQSSPYIRGFTGFRTLFLIDGIRLNNSTFRDGPNQYWNTVDPLSVARLEIVKGPASVLYGSDSISGTVNALTAGPPQDGRASKWQTRALARLSSAEDSHTFRAETSGPLASQTHVFLGVTTKSFGDLRGGDDVGRQLHTSYGEYAWDTKLEHIFSPGLKLTVAHQSVAQDDIWRTHSTVFGTHWAGLSTGTDRERSIDQRRHLTYAQLHATQLTGFVEELRLSLSHHQQHEQQTRIRANLRRDVASTDVDTFGADFQLHSVTPVGRWVYGTTFYRDWVASNNDRYRSDGSFERSDIQGPVADDAIYDVVGLYAQDQLPSWGPVDFTVRGRYDSATARAGRLLDPLTGQPDTLDASWDSFVGSGRATLRAGQHWQWFAGGSQGFRAPNLSDLSRLDSAASGQIETPSTHVSPEYYFIREAGVKARYGRLELAAGYFHTQIDGMIIRSPTGRILGGLPEVTKRNSGDGFVHGFEFQARVPLSADWSLDSAFTSMDGELTVFPTADPRVRVREPVSRLMPLTTLVGFRYEPLTRPYWLSISCTVAGRQSKLSSSDRTDTERIPPGGTPGYTTWTLRGGWRVHRNFTLSATIENLTNEDYRIHGSGINEPGRNFVLSAIIQL